MTSRRLVISCVTLLATLSLRLAQPREASTANGLNLLWKYDTGG